ncbi:MAG TPA: hypothetical protein VKZ53_30990 [Candidatus Angelobacter sp.]|nr:hypothetical protein [Candidatus Angelobacter sp.]
MKFRFNYSLLAAVFLLNFSLFSHNQLFAADAKAGGSNTKPADPTAKTLLLQAIDAMGGKEKLEAVKSLKLVGNMVVNRLDDSERYESPWWTSVLPFTEYRDLSGRRSTLEASFKSPQFEFDISTRLADGISAQQRHMGDGRSFWQTSVDQGAWYALSPERILFTAMDAPDLRTQPETMFHGVKHRVLAFTWQGFPVRVLINSGSGLPDCIESTRTNKHDLAQNAWGDVRWRTEFLFWKVDKSGVVYPRQWVAFRNEELERTYILSDVTFNADLPNDKFGIPEEPKKQFETTGKVSYDDPLPQDAQDSFSQIGEGIWMIAGNWNVGVVRQEDGLIVLECPQAPRYSQKILKAIEGRFPNVPIKGVISTTDSLWHFAGLREYVARGVPVYVLGSTAPLLQKFLAAPHTLNPDSLANAPRKAVLHSITTKTAIGRGSTRLEIIPIAGQGDERMQMVYFPEQRILYGSSNDLFPNATGALTMTFNMPELITAVKREGLQPTKFFAIHTGLLEWDKVLETVRLETSSSSAPPLSASSSSSNVAANQEAAPLAPGVISTGHEFTVTFTKDMKQVYFTRSFPERKILHILRSEFRDGSWQPPTQVAFSDDRWSDLDPALSPDGRQLFFISTRPVPGSTQNNTMDLWSIERVYADQTGEGWGEPHWIKELSSPGKEGSPTVDTNGTLCFFSDKEKAQLNSIYCSQATGSGFASPVKLSSNINSGASDTSPWMTPDGQLMLFYSKREGGAGSADLYVSTKSHGEWSPAKNLGPAVNTAESEYNPSLSPDRKTLYFGRKGQIYAINVDSVPVLHDAIERVRPEKQAAQQASTSSQTESPTSTISDLAAFFAGKWRGEGQFANGNKIEADVAFTLELDGHSLVYRHDDRPPNGFHALATWSLDPGTRKFTMFMNDNFGGARVFTSDGWQDETLIFTKTTMQTKPSLQERFRYNRLSSTTFQMTYEVSGDGKNWQMGDTLRFTKSSVESHAQTPVAGDTAASPSTAIARRTGASLPPDVLEYFQGSWSGKGSFTSGKSVESKFSFVPDLEKQCISIRHKEEPPNTFEFAGLLSVDSFSGGLVLLLASNHSAGARIFRSSGWEGDKMTFQGVPELRAFYALERFTFERKSPTNFHTTYEMSPDNGKTWVVGDQQEFTKQKG